MALLHLDLGDFLSTESHVKDLKSQVIWDAMVRMGVQATTPGSRELTDWELCQSLYASGAIPVVASNLRRIRDGESELFAEETLVLDVGGIRVGLFSLLGRNQFANARPPADLDLDLLDPLETAQRLVPQLRERAEVVVLMAQMSPTDIEPILEAVPGIDVSLAGYRPGWVEDAWKIGNTIAQSTGSKGEWLGRLTLIVDPEGRILDWGSSNAGMLKDVWVPQPQMEAIVQETELRVEELLAEAREANLNPRAQAAHAEKYLGAETCGRCHAGEYDQWAASAHANAYATLQTDHGMEFTQACVGCHVTGYDAPNGFVSANSTRPDLKNVQCEACHGAGTLHARDGSMKVEPTVCVTCHSGDFAKDFDYDTYLEMVKHW